MPSIHSVGAPLELYKLSYSLRLKITGKTMTYQDTQEKETALLIGRTLSTAPAQTNPLAAFTGLSPSEEFLQGNWMDHSFVQTLTPPVESELLDSCLKLLVSLTELHRQTENMAVPRIGIRDPHFQKLDISPALAAARRAESIGTLYAVLNLPKEGEGPAKLNCAIQLANLSEDFLIAAKQSSSGNTSITKEQADVLDNLCIPIKKAVRILATNTHLVLSTKV